MVYLPVKSEIDGTSRVVLEMIDRAVGEALKGMIRETESETNFDVESDLKPLQRWAKAMYLHFDKELASTIIDFVDEVYTGTFELVRKMIEKTVYNAIATQLGVPLTLSDLKSLCPPAVDKQIRKKASEIAVTLYNQEEVKSIAAIHMEAALFRANDLTHIYLTRRRNELLKDLRATNAFQLSEEMNRFHENAMNYFYRQALATLKEEGENAKKQVRKQYHSAYRRLLHEYSFRREMKMWLHHNILPETKHIFVAQPTHPRTTAYF